MDLEDGLNVLNVEGFGTMHVFVYDGNVSKITIFNSKVTKKKTRTIQHDGQKGHLVNLSIETDTYDWMEA